MAKVKTTDYSLRSGKLSKNSDVVYRTRSGKQQSYTPKQNTTPPSKAQKAYRADFGKITSVVNAIMADPKQVAEWEQKMLEYNRLTPITSGLPRFKTVRAFAHHIVREQLAQNQAAKRRRKGINKELPKGFKMHIKPFAELSTTELYEILKARFAVFYTEQGCRYLDMDDIDYSAIHLALHRKGKVIAYARLFKAKEKDTWIIGRMLTTERGQGFGKYIMAQTIAEAQRQGAKTLVLHAQTHAVHFYEKCGFTTFGDFFLEADIPHICMKKDITA